MPVYLVNHTFDASPSCFHPFSFFPFLCLCLMPLNVLLTKAFVPTFLIFFHLRHKIYLTCHSHSNLLVQMCSGTHHCIMSEGHGNNLPIKNLNIRPLCYWQQIMTIEWCHCTLWNYWRYVILNIVLLLLTLHRQLWAFVLPLHLHPVFPLILSGTHITRW